MNHFEQHQSEARRQHIEAIVTRNSQQLFLRLPMLSGFWLDFDLKVAELVFTGSGYTARRDLYDQVMDALVQLVEECPEAVQLMRGRTFARAVH